MCQTLAFREVVQLGGSTRIPKAQHFVSSRRTEYHMFNGWIKRFT